MGQVFAAYDPQLDRRVALKLLADKARGIGAARLVREAKALARLAHPNVVMVHDVGVHHDRVFVAMEFVEGRTLKDWDATHRNDGDKRLVSALDLLLQAGRGLAAAHESHLVHCDFKPSNVLVGNDGRVRVVDFGLARIGAQATPSDVAEVQSLTNRDSTITAEGMIAGTPAYMAPEQLGGGPLDASVDQFAFCVTAWELLSGQRPFEDRDSTSRLVAIERGELRMPATVRLPPTIETALRQGLNAAPQARYPSLGALLEVLTKERDRIAGEGITHSAGGHHPSPNHVSPALHVFLGQLAQGSPSSSTATAVMDQLRRTLGELPSDPGARLSEQLRTLSLSGRDIELSTLRRSWDETLSSGSRIVWLNGIAGSGKTRLGEALASELVGTVAVYRARCGRDDPQPYATLRQLFDAELDRIDGMVEAARVPALNAFESAIGDLMPVIAAVAPRLASTFGVRIDGSCSVDPSHTFIEGLARVLSRLLRSTSPAMVFIDDVQWLEPGSQNVLNRTLSQTSADPLLFVFAARTDDAVTEVHERMLRGLSSDRCLSLKLGPLDRTGLGHLVADYLLTSADHQTLLASVANLSDGTPMSVFEVLRAMLGAGVLQPQLGSWWVDGEAAARLVLPKRAVELLRRRVRELARPVLEVLRVAAVYGPSFDRNVLIAVRGVPDEVDDAIEQGRTASLIEDSGPAFSFVHGLVRDALLDDVSPNERRALHQSIAETLDHPMSSDPDALYELASHYAAGVLAKTPERVLDVCTKAGRAALERYDNIRALAFLRSAGDAAQYLGHPSNPARDRLVGEASLRTGDIDLSLASYRRILACATDPFVRSEAWARIAWIHETQFDSSPAWEALRHAFDELGVSMPRPTAAGAMLGFARWAGWTLRRARPAPLGEQPRLTAVASLYVQMGRLAGSTGHMACLVQASILGCSTVDMLPEATGLKSRAYMMFAFLQLLMRRTAAAEKFHELAMAAAIRNGDPSEITTALKHSSVLWGWAGDAERSSELSRECLDERSHWVEFTEFTFIAIGQHVLEAVRGRGIEAWKWLERGLHRALSDDISRNRPGLLPIAARGSLLALGRDDEVKTLLASFPTEEPTHLPKTELAFRFQFRVRMLTEIGDLGPAFEQLLDEFRRTGPSTPKYAHRLLFEFYFVVAHARVHQLLRQNDTLSNVASRSADRTVVRRTDPTKQLKEALDDLRAMPRVSFANGHRLVIEGYYAWFSNKPANALKWFEQAETNAFQNDMPWVLYAVARGRAHIHRAEGRHESALTEARKAMKYAGDHGYVHRVRWIREEFGDDVISAFR